MDNSNPEICQFAEDDVDDMHLDEVCEYLSANGINTKGSESELYQRLKLFLRNAPDPVKEFAYSSEMAKLRDVVVQIKNRNTKPSVTDMLLLVEKAKEMKSRMPIFTPKYPGFQKYGRQDLQAQAYIQYLPKVFSHEKYDAIWTNPNGRKYPLSFLGRFSSLHPKIKLNISCFFLLRTM